MNGRAALHKQLLPHVLSSWKEIAAFLGKGVRTVQRWESCLGLPVHRPGGDHGGVLAYPAEIDGWCQKQWTDDGEFAHDRHGKRQAADAHQEKSREVLRMVLELANSCAELNRRNEELQGEAGRGKPTLTSRQSLSHIEKPTAEIEPGKSRKGRRSLRNKRPSPH